MSKQCIEEAADECAPLLKWPGGKRWLAPVIVPIIRRELTGRYYEPFLGGAAIFTCLRPTKALLSDVSADLIRTLETIRDSPREVIAAVQRFSNTRDCYVRVRASVPRSPVGAAARFIFLNRTCWGGIQRFNQTGRFNVPFGNSGRVICRSQNLVRFSDLLKSASLKHGDFGTHMARAGVGDAIYADPPYTTLGQNNGFVRYNEHLFSWNDQRRLAQAARAAAARGAFVAVSGLWHPAMLDLYRGWTALELQRTVCVSRDVRARKVISEAVFFSKPPRISRPAATRSGSTHRAGSVSIDLKASRLGCSAT